MSKTAAALLALVGLTLLSTSMSAQILPRGNVYAGVSYGQLTDVINKQSYRGFEGSAEDLPFARLSHLGFVLDGSAYFRTGVKQYNAFFGPRLSATYGKWRPFVHAMGGYQRLNSNGNIFGHVAIDIGGGADYKLWFKNFSWRLQGDYMHTHYLSAYQNDYRASTGIVWRF
ncbi:MAG TPA: hypothetical protein VKA07_02890 [Candidatus Sulfotelmatobacter sp.]|nr:hypothetical protein [Candidatus Sulfotelmatobacter sp.]